MSFLDKILGKSQISKSNKSSSPKKRRLGMESLENRELLSVSTTDFDAIRTQYADLNLGEYNQYHIIEITANELTDAKLRGAISTAAGTVKDDLIVVRTTATQNKITLGGSELAIDTSNGSVTIVSFGEKVLTIDGNQRSRVINIGGNSTVAMAGLVIQNGYSIITGGGIRNRGSLTISKCSIVHNTSFSSTNNSCCGGGIYSTGSLILINSTVSNNKAVTNNQSGADTGGANASGGGISIEGMATITNCTIAENLVSTTTTNSLGRSTSEGGGIFVAGSLTLNNSIVVNNQVHASGVYRNFVVGKDMFLADNDYFGNNGCINNSTNNIIATGCYCWSHYDYDIGAHIYVQTQVPGTNNIQGSDNSPVNPGIGNLIAAKNGQYYHPLIKGSIAINRGSNTWVLSDISTDQIGRKRIIDEIVDIGAFEYGAVEVANEYLSKEWIYNVSSLKVGDIVKDADALDTIYVVEKIFSNGQGLYTVGLVNEKTGDSVLVFRGSGDPLDTLADTNVNGIGYAAYFASATDLRSWASSKASQGKVSAVGHSLGGTLAQWFAADWTSRGGTLTELETFNATGISREWADKFVNRNTKVTHHIIDGDFISMGGEAFVNGTNYIYSVSNCNSIEDKHKLTLDGLKTKYNTVARNTIATNVLNDDWFYFEDDSYFNLLSYASQNQISNIDIGRVFVRGGAEQVRQEFGSQVFLALKASQLQNSAKDFAPAVSSSNGNPIKSIVAWIGDARKDISFMFKHSLTDTTALTAGLTFSQFKVDDDGKEQNGYEVSGNVALGTNSKDRTQNLSLDIKGKLSDIAGANNKEFSVEITHKQRYNEVPIVLNTDVIGTVVFSKESGQEWKKGWQISVNGTAEIKGANDNASGVGTIFGSIKITQDSLKVEKGYKVTGKLSTESGIDAEITLDPDDVSLKLGTAKYVFEGGTAEAEFIARYQYATGVTTLSGTGNGTIKGENGDSFNGKATIQLSSDNDPKKSFAEIKTTIPGLGEGKSKEISVKKQFDDSPIEVKGIKEEKLPSFEKNGLLNVAEISTEDYLLVLNWNQKVAGAVGTIILSTGQRINELAMATDSRFAVVDDLCSDTQRVYVVKASFSEISQWRFEVEGVTGAITPSLYSFVDPLDVEAKSISQDNNGTARFNINAGTAGPDAVVTVYLDDDRADFDGFPVYTTTLADLVQNGWTPDGIAEGEYYVYIRVESGDAVPEMLYFDSSINISKKPDMPATASAVLASGNVTKITWSQVDGATSYDIMGYNAVGNYWWKIDSTTNTSYNAQGYSTNVTTIAVHAVNSTGRSAGKTTSIFRAPTTAAAVAASGNQTKISWNAVIGATAYEIMGYNAVGKYWWKIDTTTNTSYSAPAYTT